MHTSPPRTCQGRGAGAGACPAVGGGRRRRAAQHDPGAGERDAARQPRSFTAGSTLPRRSTRSRAAARRCAGRTRLTLPISWASTTRRGACGFSRAQIEAFVEDPAERAQWTRRFAPMSKAAGRGLTIRRSMCAARPGRDGAPARHVGQRYERKVSHERLRKIIIDDREIEVPPAMTLIQACEEAGIEIPRFCYHERLSIAGNCRMCLVEVVGGPPKPAASCAMQVKDLRPGPEGAAAGGAHQLADGQEGARGGDGVPAHQPPARLPDLRPGRRMRPAGSGDGLRRRFLALPRAEARGRTT
jgi:ferredoxin